MRDQSRFIRIQWAIAHRQPSAFLLAAQLLSLILYAALDELHSGRAILSAFGALILVLILWVVSRSPVVQWVAYALAVPAFSLTILSAIITNPTLVAWSSLIQAVLSFYAAGSLIAYMLGDRRVTTDELFAAGATFTLLAWGFAYLYLAFQEWVPGGFLNGGHPGQPLTFIEMLSLSFTNLSATGLGDILPVSAPTRVLVMLEQFAGVAYITIVVSRLIGLTTAMRDQKR
ncbi:MAG: ion channel [Anaerolineales bacterium]|jgi:hypothetical protein|nr:ion channel [Anaerolineales bacterium]